MKHDDRCELLEGRDTCHCASRAYRRDPLPGVPPRAIAELAPALPPVATVRVRVSVQPMVEALTLVGRAFAQLGEALGQAVIGLRRYVRPHVVAELRARAGGSGDPYSDDWQCGPCTGWIHASCAGLAQPLVSCRCTCRGGHLR